MILQQKIEIPVWGWAPPQTRIHVQLNSRSAETITNTQGKWMLKLGPLDAGGPFTMKIWGSGDTLFIMDVLIGEVFLASGQSNMEYPMNQGIGPDTDKEIRGACYPEIRFFQVDRRPMCAAQAHMLQGKWKHCTPGSVPFFSAVAYFFAREIHLTKKVPVGIISSTWGGTPIQAWMSSEKLAQDPEYTELIAKSSCDTVIWNEHVRMYRNSNNYRDSLIRNSTAGLAIGANLPYFIDNGWKECRYPSEVSKLTMSHEGGFIWFRKSFDVTEVTQIKEFYIDLSVYGADYLMYINGQPVQWVKVPGKDNPVGYIHGSQVILGRNILSVRLLFWTAGGIGLRDVDARLISTDSLITIDLKGTWRYNGDIEPPIPQKNNYYKKMSVLFNGMIAPLIPYAINGVIWYQGEENAADSYKYGTLFPMMIEDWRTRWGQGNFPFMFVQLANFMKKKEEPGNDNWAELRESQLMTLRVPNTAMAVAIDLGDANDIHPKNKKDVAMRLFLAAERLIYGKKLVYSGPVYKSMKIRNGEIWLTFLHNGSGLTTIDGQPLRGFAVAGKNKKFRWADAKIEGDKVVVSCSKIKNPVAVRYSWEINPNGNLYNLERLPASPFRTDDWKLLPQ